MLSLHLTHSNGMYVKQTDGAPSCGIVFKYEASTVCFLEYDIYRIL